MLVCLLPLAGLPARAAGPARAESAAAAEPSPDALWAKAVAARDADRLMEAALLFQRYQNLNPQNPRAEEALWQAAQLAKKHALGAKKPEWRYVRDLFKRYTVDYPKSPRYPEAYFEGGVAHSHLRLFREALIYFNLFQKRFPGSPLVPEVRWWQGQTLLEVGRLDEARVIFEGLARSQDPSLRLRGQIGLAHTLYGSGQYAAALAAYREVEALSPGGHLEDPSLLFWMGMSNFRVGNEEEGRRNAFHFLNLDRTSPHRAEAMFEIGESYLRGGDKATAQRLYLMVLDEGAPEERLMVLSRFRQAQYNDDPARLPPEWGKQLDLADPAGDQPYLALLDLYHGEPVAQEARLGLLRRHQARKDDQQVYDVAVNYLQYAPAGPLRQEVETVVGDILVRRVEEYLAKQRYREVYDLYRTEYRYVAVYGKGRLRYLVGKAFEALSLNDQAAVIYYRALALPLTDAEKIDIYYRRARIYLALKDWPAAERLLAYLRKMYSGDRAVSEVFYLSGRLSEARGRVTEALGFYRKAVTLPPVAERRPVYAAAILDLLFRQGGNAEAQTLLARLVKEGWLEGGEAQRWYARLGGNLRQAGDVAGAAAAYSAGLGASMPQEGEVAQAMHVSLGDALVALGKGAQGRAHYTAARSGPSELWKRVGTERLQQLTLDSTLSNMGQPVLGK